MRIYRDEPATFDELSQHALLLAQMSDEPDSHMVGYLAQMRAAYFMSVSQYPQAHRLATQAWAIAHVTGNHQVELQNATFIAYLQLKNGQTAQARSGFGKLMRYIETAGAGAPLPPMNIWMIELAEKFATPAEKETLRKRYQE